MPAPTVPDDQKDRLNHADKNYEERINQRGAAPDSTNDELSKLNDMEKGLKDPSKQASQSVSEAEENPSDGFYKPSENSKGFNKKRSFSARLRGGLKKRSPLVIVLLVLFGGGGMASVLLAPGLGIVHMKETLVNDLNDQLTALDKRMDHVFRSKLKSLTGVGICSEGIKIRCQFTSMSDRQVNKFRKAGFVVDTEPDKTAFGRNRIKAISFTSGGVTTTITDPQQMATARRQVPEVRKALNRVFNPAFAGMSDKLANGVLKGRFKTSKAPKITATNADEINKQVANEINKNKTSLEDGQRVVYDEDSKQYSVVDENGQSTAISEEQAKQIEEGKSRMNAAAEAAKAGAKATSNILGGIGRALLITGVADTACVVYNTARGVAAAAKAIRAIQLAQFAMVFLNTADAIKAGDATPEAVAYVGDGLVATDINKQIVDVLSEDGELMDNPYYGKGGFDSPGYKAAAYNDAVILTPRDQQYMVGGGLSGEMTNVISNITAIIGGSDTANITCKIIQHPFTRIAAGIVGIAIAWGSFGTSTAILGGMSAALSFALPFLESMMADMVAGTVVDAATKGVDAGNANFVGTSVILGGVAQARGAKPQTAPELEEYTAATNEVKSEYIAQAKYEAKDTPLDIMNQYSFLGSLARTVYPIATQAASGIAGFISSIPQLLLSPFTKTATDVKALSYNPDRFNKCPDVSYAELGIAADIFCNVRYGFSAEEMAMDSEEVVKYMLANDYINDEGNAISGSDYDKFLTNCANRTDGWGEISDGEGAGTNGSECMEVSAKYSNFRVYTMDRSINDAMDEDGI